MASSNTPVVAVDAVGGDHGPSVIVPGAVDALAAEADELRIALYGDPSAIERELAHLGAADDPRLSVVGCGQRIEMGESPASAIGSSRFQWD